MEKYEKMFLIHLCSQLCILGPAVPDTSSLQVFVFIWQKNPNHTL